HIKNISSLLLEDVYGPLTKEQKWGVKVIFEKVQEAIDVTNLYLSVAELEAGHAIISKEKTDLVQLVKEQIKKILYGANQKGIEVITELQKDLPKIRVDAEKIGTVFYTILDNGVKYSPQNGKLFINLKKLENKYILFSCQDSGIGLSKEEISELGKIPYQRSKRARSAHGTGIGLALYLSNLIIRGHGAELWAESEGHGKGTTFNVKIPID
ncbi:MAG: hypothetical protein COT33_00490, partial [Candidatus Nealsonbacteria bacterium CG08_land_8_20_14_0_20_38_20]